VFFAVRYVIRLIAVGVGRLGFDFRRGQFCPTIFQKNYTDYPAAVYSLGDWQLSAGVNLLKCEADHSLPSVVRSRTSIFLL
jgi:hypothetical protein